MRKLWALLAPAGFRAETERELAHRGIRYLRREEDFFLFEGEPIAVRWSQVIWLDVREVPFSSLADGVKKLRPLARTFDYLPLLHRGRGKLMHEQLRVYKRKVLEFPDKLVLPEAVGVFTLLDNDKIALFCRSFDRPDPLGISLFHEDKTGAPSRAYLKLWEAFALTGRWPLAGEKVVDLGACPGGWTWVLATLGAEVLAVDRAPLDPRVAAMHGVAFRKADAFQLKPNIGRIDWLCSDVICRPEKLLELVREWVASGQALNFVCTLKFQGEADPAVVEEFALLGRVVHLFQNKHELTFIRLQL
jgi:23S rRNA (cytidine2498-2'-O)-methyltransferase